MPVSLKPSARPSTSQIAKEIIDEIRRERGHIDANDELELSKTFPDWQKDYRQREEKRCRDYARYTKTVADHLHTSKFRFIHELLQNADDAEYRSDVSPSLTFRVRASELIVDSNEQGFTKANVLAISSTGESSKLKDINTTGEKGLGFKSIFGIANKIHVQSGQWSFRFEHARGQSGLGMVTPIWTATPHEAIPAGIGTRFRLTYAQQDEAFLAKIVDEFDKLPDTIIFALRKLQRLVVVFEDVKGRQHEKVFEKGPGGTTHQMTITTSIRGSNITSSSNETRLKVVRRTLRNMPSDELRSSDQSEIVLAFQVSATGEPVIPSRGHHVFAYLPVQRLSHLPFVIQGDFVLAANREAIPENDWNEKLREGVATAFTSAVLHFAQFDPVLRYRWMEYLPSHLGGGFWDTLDGSISNLLRSSEILVTREKIQFRRPAGVRIVPTRFMRDGKPLVADLENSRLYLSEHYSKSNIEKLKPLGLQVLTDEESVARLIRDACTEPSKLRTTDLSDEWHTAYLSFIGDLIASGMKSQLQGLPFIPLSEGQWVTPGSLAFSPVYLPYAIDHGTVRVEIPKNIGLLKLHLAASKVSDRLTVYANLGIGHCSSVALINNVMDAQVVCLRSKLRDFVAHLEILFWYGHTSPPPLKASFSAVDTRKKLRDTTRLFFQTEKKYEAFRLLGDAPLDEISDFGFLHEQYASSVVRNSIRQGKTWTQWLEQCTGVRYYPTMIDPSAAKLHPLLKVTARDKSYDFIGAMHTYWVKSYQWEHWKVETELQNIPVQCQNGATVALGQTTLPTAELMSKADTFKVSGSLNFLNVPDDALQGDIGSWKFLATFGVICEPDINFYMSVLDSLKNASGSVEELRESCKCVYSSIAEVSKLGEADNLRTRFQNGQYIFVDSPVSPWRSPDACVWNGPAVLRSKRIVSNVYQGNPGAKSLFVDLLKMRDATHADILQDLIGLRNTELEASPKLSPSLLSPIYQALSKLATDQTRRSAVRASFNSNKLIYASSRWVGSSEAVWNCTLEISGRLPIGNLYPQLESFFLDTIGVITMNANLLLQELKRLSSLQQPDGNEIRNVMLVAGQIIAVKRNDEQLTGSVQALENCRYLPIQQGQRWIFKKASENFFIIDHERYGAAFCDKIDFLDFSHGELISLHPLFQLLGLDSYYISRHVQSQSIINQTLADPDLTTHFQQRAYALSCCAIAHHSPKYFNRDSKTHHILQAATIFLCDGMLTKLLVRTGESHVEASNDRPLAEIRLSDDSLKIVVPADASGLSSCYKIDLPAQLLSILGLKDKQAEKQVYRILNDEARSLDAIMADEDIPAVPWLEKPPPLPQPEVETVGTTHVLQIPRLESTDPASTLSVVLEGPPPRTPPPAYREGKTDPLTPPLTAPKSAYSPSQRILGSLSSDNLPTATDLGQRSARTPASGLQNLNVFQRVT